MQSFVSDWSVNTVPKTEVLHAPICDTTTLLFSKAAAVLKMHIVISVEHKVDITYTIYSRSYETTKVITHFPDAKRYYDML